MRRIKGSQSSGFARLYGAKDVEQFIRQARYMADFTDDFAERAAITGELPAYADLTLRQLRSYFTWRARFRSGIAEPCPPAYALLYFFELLNGVTEAEEPPPPEELAFRIADAWLALREPLPMLDARLPDWFKDFYLSREFSGSFGELVKNCYLTRFYPALLPLAGDGHGTRALLESSGHHYRRSKFFLDRPELCALLEEAFPAVLRNLEPLFALSGIALGDVFAQRPERFFYYELFKGAAARPPQAMPNREVAVGQNEIYRCRGGNWSRAASADFGAPGGNAAVGCVVRRIEAAMRGFFGYRYKLSPEASEGQLERWMHSEGFPQAMFALLADETFAALVDETTRQICLRHGPLPGDGLIPQAQELKNLLDTEPYQSLLRMKSIPGGSGEAAKIRQFQRQGALLAKLEDSCSLDVPCVLRQPLYDNLRHDQLRCYLSWRTLARRGDFRPTAKGYVYLYCAELLFGIGTEDPFRDVFSLLRHAAAQDRALERRLPGWIFDLWLVGKREEPFADLVRRHGAEAWYPLLFLETEGWRGDILPLWNQIASYKLLRSRFYDPQNHEALNRCLCAVLEAAKEALKREGFSLEGVLFTKLGRQQNWIPFEGLVPEPPHKLPPAQTEINLGPREAYYFHGRSWVTHRACSLTPQAAPFAGCLLKNMEVRLRELCRFPYKMGGAPDPAMVRLLMGNRKLLKVLESEAFLRATRDAVDVYFASHPVAVASRTAVRSQKKPVEQSVPLPLPPPPVRINFERLERIRGEARAIMERLIVEEEDADTALPSIPAPLPSPPPDSTGEPSTSLQAALTPAERAVIEYLRTGQGLPPPMDELMLDRINEAALDLLGDTLIDTSGDAPRLYEEYRDH